MIKLLVVFSLGAVELLAAIPAGLAMRLHPAVISITAATGAILGAFVVSLLGERARAWLTRHRGRKDKKGWYGRVYRIWHRYGVMGLGLLAPLLTGIPLGVALGIALGAPASRLLFWVSFGIILWSMGLTFIGVLGLTGIDALWK
ncbi:MAG TPA: small multi-drug export protein [Anaerolineae bacterium]|nr:small multi-drug export protein [Anaerolineae bacterium]